MDILPFDKRPEEVSIDLLMEKATAVVFRFMDYAAMTFPLITALEHFKRYCSQLEGIEEVWKDGEINIAAPLYAPEFPEMMQGVPIAVPYEIKYQDRSFGVALNGMYHVLGALEVQRRVEGKSFLGARIVINPQDGMGGILLKYQSRNDKNPWIRQVTHGKNPQVRRTMERGVEDARKKGITITEMTPYEGLQVLDYVANTLLGMREVEKIAGLPMEQMAQVTMDHAQTPRN